MRQINIMQVSAGQIYRKCRYATSKWYIRLVKTSNRTVYDVNLTFFRVTTLQTMWNSPTVHDTPLRHSAENSYYACTSVTFSAVDRNAAVLDPKPYISYLTQNRLLLNTCMDANMQLTMNSFRQLFPDNMFSPTLPWFSVKSLTFKVNNKGMTTSTDYFSRTHVQLSCILWSIITRHPYSISILDICIITFITTSQQTLQYKGLLSWSETLQLLVKSTEKALFNSHQMWLDPSAAPPPLFRLARTKSGWRADQNSAGGGGRLFRWQRRNSARPRERRHITLLVSLSMEHVVSTASVVTV